MSFGLPRLDDAIPYAGDTTERAARFTSPNINQRVQVGGTAITRWNGTTWLTDLMLGASAGLGWVNVKDPIYGATGDGTTDDTTAIQAAITAVSSSGVGIFFPAGTYKLTSPLTVSSAGCKLFGLGYLASTLRKSHTGNAFNVTGGTGVEFRNLAIVADTATSATYAQGRGIYWTGTSAEGRILNVAITNIDICLEIAANAAPRLMVAQCYFQPYTTTTGSEGRCIYISGTDSGATQRHFTDVTGSGIIELVGALDCSFTACVVRRAVDASGCFAVAWTACLFGSLGVAMTWAGTTTFVQGCRIAGDVTLASTFTGAFMGNTQTAGTFTNSTLRQNAVVVLHKNTNVNTSSVLYGSVSGDVSTLTDAATVAINAGLGNYFLVTLGGNRAMGAPTNPSAGQVATFTVIQDGTGGRTLTWNAVFKLTWSDTGNTAGKRSSISCVYDGTNWNQVGAQTPYV